MAKLKSRASGDDLHELFHEVFLLHAALSAVMDEVHEQAGLRTSQCKVADALERAGPASVPEVAARLGVSRQFVQTICNEFEEMALIEFKDSPRHKRSKLVTLTEKGRRTLAQAWRSEAAIIEKALPEIDAKTTSEATVLLATIRKTLSGQEIAS
jgi:DNA-binding MarR family transcriptional regulator